MGKSLFEIQKNMLQGGRVWNPSEEDKKAMQQAAEEARRAEEERRRQEEARRRAEEERRRQEEARRRAEEERRREREAARQAEAQKAAQAQRQAQQEKARIKPTFMQAGTSGDLWSFGKTADNKREHTTNQSQAMQWQSGKGDIKFPFTQRFTEQSMQQAREVVEKKREERRKKPQGEPFGSFDSWSMDERFRTAREADRDRQKQQRQTYGATIPGAQIQAGLENQTGEDRTKAPMPSRADIPTQDEVRRMPQMIDEQKKQPEPPAPMPSRADIPTQDEVRQMAQVIDWLKQKAEPAAPTPSRVNIPTPEDAALQAAINEQNRIPEGYRSATLKDATIGSFEQGYLDAERGKEIYKQMTGASNHRQAYDNMLAGEKYRYVPDKWYTKLLSALSQGVARQASQTFDPETVAYVAAAGTAAGVAGQAGPQALTPEEIITVPSAMVIGATVGSAKQNYEIETGLAYDEMVKAGISPDVAAGVAMGIGFGSSMLDAAHLDELVKSYRVLDKSGVANPIKDELGRVLANYMVDVGIHGLESSMQEGIKIGGYSIANAIEGKAQYPVGEVVSRLGSAFGDGALLYGIEELPGVAHNTAQKLNTVKQIGQGLREAGAVLDVIDTGLNLDSKTESYNLAQILSDQYGTLNGESPEVPISDYDIGRLYLENFKELNSQYAKDPQAMADRARIGELPDNIILADDVFHSENIKNRIEAVYKRNQVDKLPEVVYNGDRLFVDGEEMVTVRRIQGGGDVKNGSMDRLGVNSDGTVEILDKGKGKNISVSVDDGRHAHYFATKRQGDSYMVEFEVPRSMYDDLASNTIDQSQSRQYGGKLPKRTDPNVPGLPYELPPDWMERLVQEARNGRIVMTGQ